MFCAPSRDTNMAAVKCQKQLLLSFADVIRDKIDNLSLLITRVTVYTKGNTSLNVTLV